MRAEREGRGGKEGEGERKGGREGERIDRRKGETERGTETR